MVETDRTSEDVAAGPPGQAAEKAQVSAAASGPSGPAPSAWGSIAVAGASGFVGGAIAAESAGPGRGATFRFTLPIAR